MTIPSPRSSRDEHLRGPGRGDRSRGHRSAEWWRQHDDALTRPCPYEVATPRRPGRRRRPDPWRCAADVGQPCVRYPSRTPLEHLPAHDVRLHPHRTPAARDGAHT